MLDLYSKIKACESSSGKLNYAKILAAFKREPDLLCQLIDSTKHLSQDTKIAERCYNIIHNITSRPTCSVCNSAVKYACGKYNQTCGSKECHTKLRTRNAAKTMHEEGTYKKTGDKHRVRMASPDMKLKHSRAISLALSVVDETGTTAAQRAAKTLKNSLANNPNIIAKREPKRRKTMEQRGRWVPLDQLDAAIAYRLKVHSVTMAQPLHLLPNFNLRGPSTSDASVQNFHIDHIFSVMDGFKHDIAPEIIGHISNLRMLHHKENVRKNGKSDISKEELLLRYSTYSGHALFTGKSI